VATAEPECRQRPGYWFDEVYMLAVGRHHLDWGSADQPALTPALAALMDLIAPGSTTVLRIPAILATAGAVAAAGLIARELGCDRRAQVLTAGAQATGVWTSLAGHWLTPYTLEPVQWLVLIWLLVRWIRARVPRLERSFRRRRLRRVLHRRGLHRRVLGAVQPARRLQQHPQLRVLLTSD
jgi:hypothetical protein